MTDKQHTDLSTYVRTLADMLGLKDAVVEISRDEPEREDCAANVRGVPGRKFWSVSFGPRFWEMTADDKRETIVHELLHCHMDPALDHVRTDLYENRIVGHQQYVLIYDAMLRTFEVGIDGIAHAIACHFPLPEWGEDGTK